MLLGRFNELLHSGDLMKLISYASLEARTIFEEGHATFYWSSFIESNVMIPV